MSIHLVAIDLDGTLLNSEKQISKATAAILRTAKKEHGVHIVLATARPPRSVLPFYTLLDLDTPMINYNGALVFDPASNRVLMHKPIAVDLCKRIIAVARKVYPDIQVGLEVLDRWYTDHLDKAYLTATGQLFEPDVVAPLEDCLTSPVTKLLLLGPKEKMAEIRAAMVKPFVHQVIMTQTEGELVQISHATVSKAHALRVVAGEMGVMRDQIMAIGDQTNDVDMLRWAGIGVAMGNAVPEVLAVADMVTDHHDADGAAKAIHEVIIRGRVPKTKNAH
jgi:hypothetical protein